MRWGGHGAGKSSLGYIISGLVGADSGEIIVNGRRLSRFNNRIALAEGITMVRQSPSISKHRTATENIYMAQTSFNRGLLAGKNAAVSGSNTF